LGETVAADHSAHLVDVFRYMIHANGSPRHELFCDDWLHLSAAGYQLWTRLVRGALSEIGVVP
jgi:lysophospholipase L1-like esterase